MGLCTTLICTLLSDMALRWVAHYEDFQLPPSATPRERMVARMEWNEHLERYAVPWVLDIGLPGPLYVALFFFFVGAISRAFPSLNTPVCWAFGVVCLVFSLRELWRFEPALDARLLRNFSLLPLGADCAIATWHRYVTALQSCSLSLCGSSLELLLCYYFGPGGLLRHPCVYE
ncbi:hypothetical protein EI94DRAFT_1328822 [Lactarius quietus]|nr:hypothetical protein EI94DRAFT_1328822 [Lactarius quietus]